jgi:hypothetical protein
MILLLKRHMVLALILFAWPLLVQAGRLGGSVIGVLDGDTISVMLNGAPTGVRLTALIVLSLVSPSAQAKQFTSMLAFGIVVTWSSHGS